MEIKLDNDGNISFRLSELVESMTDEQKTQLTHFAMWDDELFEMVVGRLKGDVVWDGWYQSSDRVTERIRLILIDEYPAIARATIKQLMHERDVAKADAERKEQWARSLQREWPEAYWNMRPDQPKWAYTSSPTSEQIDAELAKHEAVA